MSRKVETYLSSVSRTTVNASELHFFFFDKWIGGPERTEYFFFVGHARFQQKVHFQSPCPFQDKLTASGTFHLIIGNGI